MTGDLRELAGWLQQKGIRHVAMESTGVYWKPVWNILERAGFELRGVICGYIRRSALRLDQQLRGRRSRKKSDDAARLLDPCVNRFGRSNDAEHNRADERRLKSRASLFPRK